MAQLACSGCAWSLANVQAQGQGQGQVLAQAAATSAPLESRITPSPAFPCDRTPRPLSVRLPLGARRPPRALRFRAYTTTQDPFAPAQKASDSGTESAGVPAGTPQATPEAATKSALSLSPSPRAPLPPRPPPTPPVRPDAPGSRGEKGNGGGSFGDQQYRDVSAGHASGVPGARGAAPGAGGAGGGPVSPSSLREILEKAERMGREEGLGEGGGATGAPGAADGRADAGDEGADAGTFRAQAGAVRPQAGGGVETSAKGEAVGGSRGGVGVGPTAEGPNGAVGSRAPRLLGLARSAVKASGDRWQKGQAGNKPAGGLGGLKLTLKKDLDRQNADSAPGGQGGSQGRHSSRNSDGSYNSANGAGAAGGGGAAGRPQGTLRSPPSRPASRRPGPPGTTSAPARPGGRTAGGDGNSSSALGQNQSQRPGPGGSLGANRAPSKGREAWRGRGGGAAGDGKPGGASARKAVSSEEVRGNRRSSKQAKKAAREEAARAAAPVKQEILEVGKGGMSVPDLAEQLAVNESEVVRTLFMKGIVTTVNDVLDEDTVKIVCAEHGVEVLEVEEVAVEDLAKKQREFLDEDDLDSLVVRPPVVTVMGHVDHGKTSLLDFIRKSQVAEGEAGGITQAIGAYRVPVMMDSGKEEMCVFLDTPGHQAFSAMRARGARVTDLAIIVVAADDGVRPQTLEAVAHAKAANVPMVVAINKTDKEGANAERVMQELSAHGVMPEEWGGDTPMVPVSALSGDNMDKLLETVMLVAELQELQANPDRPAVGTVIEAQLDKYKGPVATLLVQNGTLHKGDVVLCGETYGKVRALLDDTGARAESAGPSTAVQVLGLSGVPLAGDEFQILSSLDEARKQAEETAGRMRAARLAALQGESKVTLAALAKLRASAGDEETGEDSSVELHSLNVILKVDCQGSVEAIREALQALPQDSVSLRFLLQAPGDVAMSDLDLAVASGAVVVAFNVSVPPAVESAAAEKSIEIRQYRVIYDLVDDFRKAMEGLLGSVEERKPLGQAEVRAVFGAGSSRVAGVMVTEGKLVKGCGVCVRRGKRQVHVGTLDSLRRVKELAKEVVAGLECGAGIDGFNEWQEGDVIEAFEVVERERTLEDASQEVSAAVERTATDLGVGIVAAV